MNENFLSSKKTAFLFLSVSFLFFVFAILNFYGSEYYPGDGMRHYIVSRWCWKHHDLLLYHWGKPFFTLISSPFSQFGLKGIQFFNLIVSAGGAWLLFRYAKEKEVANAVLLILFVFFAIAFFNVINTGLTEPLFFFMIAVPAFLFHKEKYVWSCLLLSFLPYVRSEGNMIIMLFIAVLAWRKKWKYIPLLAFGTIAYSIAGGFYYDDFLWIWTMNPYDGTNRDFYGSGELLHFVKGYKYLLGTPLSITFLLGMLFYVRELVKKGFKKFVDDYDIEVVVLLGSFLIYFVAHSIFWWKGLYNSLGLIRAIAGVIPVATICCLHGLNLFCSFIKINNVPTAIASAFAIIVVANPFLLKKFPFTLDAEDRVTEEAIQWFNSSPHKNQLVIYLNPYFADRLNRDPFDGVQMRELWGLLPSLKEWGHSVIPDSTIIFWDAHYGPNECRVPLDSMTLNPIFELQKTFKPEQNFQTLGGYDYAIHAFVKTTPHDLVSFDSTLYDFESDAGFENAHTINGDKFLSGTQSCLLDDKNEYGAAIVKNINDITHGQNVRAIKVSLFIYSEQILKGAKFVISVAGNDGKGSYWEGKQITVTDSELKKWAMKEFIFVTDLSTYSENNPTIKMYVWNSAKEMFWVDDLKIILRN